MSYISLLRQRIKVIQTIRKTTSAMQLATRAIQSRLRKKEEIFKAYAKALTTIEQQHASLQTPLKQTDTDNTPAPAYNKIVLLIGSHKGLCGAFNERLFAFFRRNVATTWLTHVIAVGSQASQFLAAQNIRLEHHFDHFTNATITAIAQQLLTIITKAAPIELVVVSNTSRTFFLQQPRILTISVTAPQETDGIDALIFRLKLQSTIIQFLYDSLIAEQSARFLSMDNATRNAEEILAQAKIDYNKLRQTLVTRELLELTNSFLKE